MPLVYFVDEIRTPFVINDIKQIAKKVDSICLFSVNSLTGKESLPANVVVFEEFIDWQNFKPLRIVLHNLFSVLGIYFRECYLLKKVLPFKKSIALLASNIYKADCLLKKLRKHNETLIAHDESLTYYSFWFYDCIYLAWLKKKEFIKKAITRTHSGDLYEDHISIKNKILFRNFQFRYLDFVLPVSQMGTKYLQKRYWYAKNKIKTIYLGSKDSGLNSFTNNRFTIVSCASFRHHKRIHKIAEMLLHIEFPLTWFHFGDERLDSNDPKIEEYKKNKALLKDKSNIIFKPMGLTSNEKILQFYKNNPVNLFVSLSAVEGIPVSMMEAVSFGIPILSTDVGGCREIVTAQTGVLIPLETTMEKVADIITEFKDSKQNTAEFRIGVRKFWEEKFDADSNYKETINIII